MKKLLLNALFLVFFPSLYSQFYEYGQDPGSIKWKYADSDHFRLIFPESYQNNSPKTLWLLELAYVQNSEEFKHLPAKINVVVHNQSVVSNGFVALAPRRMELFVFPDSHGYPGDRIHQLTLHEMRHVVQMSKLNQGFTRFLSVFIGEQANGLVAGMLPFWLLEGDAILAETEFTRGGRGRMPYFEKEIKAILLEKDKKYSYDKSYFGSYKNFVPDYYRLGFPITAFAKEKYGEDFWIKGIEYTGRNSWKLSPLSIYLKKKTGAGRDALYYESMDYVKNHWKHSASERRINDYYHNVQHHKVYTNYLYPHILDDSTMVSLKTGLDIAPTFIHLLPDGSEKTIFKPGFLQSGKLSVHNNVLLWDESVSDIRWSNRNFSELRMFDMASGSRKNLSRGTRYYSPAFSTNGDTVVVIESDEEGNNSLVLISPETAEVFSKSPSPDNAMMQSPVWIKGTSLVAAIISNDQGKSILACKPHTNTWESIFYSGFHDIHDLSFHNGYLIFRAAFSGIDDIYALDIDNRALYRLTFTKYGAYNPSFSPNGDEISFSEYTVNGFKPVKMKFLISDEMRTEIKSLESNEQPFFQTRFDPEYKSTALNIPAEYQPEIKKYSRIANLFRFHSWVPFYFDYTNPSLENPEINPGLSLVSQNILSTALTSIGYEYSNNDHFFRTSFTYKGIFPVLSFSSSFGGTPFINRRNSDPVFPGNPGMNQSYSLLSYLPLSFNSGKYINGIQAIMKLSYTGNYYYYETLNQFKKGMIFAEPRLYLYSYLRRAHRDLQPRAGIVADARITSTPLETEQLGRISSLRTTAYLPGFSRNHGIKLQAQWQQQSPEKYLFNTQISFIRGYQNLNSIGLQTLSADYVFPLIYPDLRLSWLLYLKRVHASLFIDYLKGSNVYEIINNNRVISDKTLRSFGTEIYFEYHFFRILFPFVHGVRLSYLEESEKFRVEGIFKIDIGRF
jgi:hypothetical protein